MQFYSTDKCGKIISDFPKRIRSHNFRDKRNIMAVDSELKGKKKCFHHRKQSIKILETKELLKFSGNGQKGPNKFET